MTFRELKISGAYEYTPRQFGDDRGVFFEWFKASLFEETTGRALDLKQAN
ncbi:dTDP-4-dehydrorhamnose 3,5-epimerase family protein, partial [Rhodococcoides fascians]